MANNVYKINGSGIRIPMVSADPASPENGMLWYNTTDNLFKKYENGVISSLGSDDTAAADVSYDNSTSGLTATDLQDAVDELAAADEAIVEDVDDLATLTGVPLNSTSLGTFTGTTISDNVAIKNALQELETAVETKATQNDVLLKDGSVALEDDLNLGGNKLVSVAAPTDATDGATKDYVDTYAVPLTQKGANNGVATLDAGGKIPASQLPSSVMEFKGAWDASTNTPELEDGVGDAGDVYRVSVAGTVDFGSGDITFNVGDWVMYNGTVWQWSGSTDAVTSVNGLTGAVVLDTDDVDEGSTNLYFEAGRAQTAAVVNSLAGTETVQAPSVAAVNTALDTKLSEVVEDTTPSLGGNLDVGDNVLMHGSNGLRVGSSGSAFYETQYIESITLNASATNTVLTALSLTIANHEAAIIEYKIKEATTNRVRTGTLHISTNSTDTSIVDTFTETGDVGVVWNLNISAGVCQVRYTTTANNKTMHAITKRIKA